MKKLLLKEDERLMQSDSVDIGRGRNPLKLLLGCVTRMEIDALRTAQRNFPFLVTTASAGLFKRWLAVKLATGSTARFRVT